MTLLRSANTLASAACTVFGRQQRALCSLVEACSSRLQPAQLPRAVGSSTEVVNPHCFQHQGLRGFAAGSSRNIFQADNKPSDPSPPAPTSGENFQSAADTSSSDSEGEAEEGAEDLEDPESSLVEASPSGQPAAVKTEKDELLQQIQSASKKHQRHMLQQLLSRSDMSEGQTLGVEEETNAAIKAARENYSLKLVDVNSTNKGSPKGGIQSFSAMVVVGNHKGLLGHGTGKAGELVAAIRKASMRALNSLTFVPRWEQFTILHPVDTKFGKCKLRMYPLASGGGIRANALLGDIAALAGIKAIGIKTHGSRNARNSVKALFQAFGELTTIEKQAQEKGMAAVEVILGTRPRQKQRFKYASRLTK